MLIYWILNSLQLHYSQSYSSVWVLWIADKRKLNSKQFNQIWDLLSILLKCSDVGFSWDEIKVQGPHLWHLSLLSSCISCVFRLASLRVAIWMSPITGVIALHLHPRKREKGYYLITIQKCPEPFAGQNTTVLIPVAKGMPHAGWLSSVLLEITMYCQVSQHSPVEFGMACYQITLLHIRERGEQDVGERTRESTMCICHSWNFCYKNPKLHDITKRLFSTQYRPSMIKCARSIAGYYN